MGRIAAVTAVVCALAACSESRLSPTAATPLSLAVAAPAVGPPASIARDILMLDECDPESFNSAIGPGTCVNRHGGIAFDVFISLLELQQRVPSWRFSVDTIHVPSELTLTILNRGGEVHTFTEVEEFGGGVVPDLNALAGTPVPAPECLSGADFIPAGGSTSHTFAPGEKEKYQCCIHPWMRAESR